MALALCLSISCEQIRNDNFNPNSDSYIEFEDPIVKTALLEYPGVDMNGDHEISYKEASSVKTLAQCFENYRDRIYSFDEFQYFVGLETTSELFVNCYNLQSIKLPKITAIDNGTFCNCYALKNIDIPDSILELGYGAFYLCN